MKRRVYALVDDLLFASKLETAGRGLGVEVACLSSGTELLERLGREPPDLIILDLNAGHLEPLEFLRGLGGSGSHGVVPTVGYCSHVDVHLMRAAETAGCGRVMPRSSFTENLPAILQGEPT